MNKFHLAAATALIAAAPALAQTPPLAVIPAWACGSLAVLKVAGGSGYRDGEYYLPLTGGSGSGATAHLWSAGGKVGAVILGLNGQGYKTGDSVTADVPGGNGFKLTVLATRPMPLNKDGSEWLPTGKLRWPMPPCPADNE